MSIFCPSFIINKSFKTACFAGLAVAGATLIGGSVYIEANKLNIVHYSSKAIEAINTHVIQKIPAIPWGTLATKMSGFWASFKSVASSGFSYVQKLFSGATWWTSVQGYGKSALEFFKTLPGALVNIFGSCKTAYDEVKKWIITTWSQVQSWAPTAWTSVKEFAPKAWSFIKEKLKSISDTWTKIKDFFTSSFNVQTLKSIKELPQNLPIAINLLKDNWEFIKAIWSELSWEKVQNLSVLFTKQDFSLNEFVKEFQQGEENPFHQLVKDSTNTETLKKIAKVFLEKPEETLNAASKLGKIMQQLKKNPLTKDIKFDVEDIKAIAEAYSSDSKDQVKDLEDVLIKQALKKKFGNGVGGVVGGIYSSVKDTIVGSVVRGVVESETVHSVIGGVGSLVSDLWGALLGGGNQSN